MTSVLHATFGDSVVLFLGNLLGFGRPAREILDSVLVFAGGFLFGLVTIIFLILIARFFVHWVVDLFVSRSMDVRDSLGRVTRPNRRRRKTPIVPLRRIRW